MRAFGRAVLAASIATLILVGTEMVAGYPRPSSASGAFFVLAFVTYLPFAVIAAGLLSALSPRRGLDLWFPVFAGVLRMASSLRAATDSLDWLQLLRLVGALVVILVIRARIESSTRSPPFLFGLTVGIVLPILIGRIARGMLADQLGGSEPALGAGVVTGLLAFVLLRTFVARWPRVGPVFLLGPILSLGWWGRPNPSPSPVSGSSASLSEPRRPDIVLIVLDTVRAQALAMHGYDRDTMPSLEAFARRSTTFRRAWTNGSWTVPGHASLFSGLNVTRHHYDSGFDQARRTPPTRFIAARLRSAGYATGAVAANFGVFGREEPLLHGFESIEAEPLRPFALRPWLFELIGRFPRAPWLRPQSTALPGPSMRAPWVVDKALEFWLRPETRPRFLFVNLMEAHLPWIPESQDLGRFGPPGLEVEGDQLGVLGRYLTEGRPTTAEVGILRARYHEALYSLDRSLARLLDGVAKGKRGEAPIIVVTSDHGESLGEHDRFGHRNSLDEEATRIPLIIQGKGLGAGEERDTPVQVVDVFGYLAASAGLRLEPDLDARPFGERRHVVLEHRPGPQGALPSSYPRGDLSGLIEWPFKYLEGTTISPSLFDLAADPSELRNLAAVEPDRVQALRAILRDRSKAPSEGAPVRDRESEERLRALGYVR